MPRRPEIGNVQLYPNRRLNKSDRNGYVLKFFCPIRQTRVRKNTGTRERREARRIQRECRERLLNGEYVTSNGAITKPHHPRPTMAVRHSAPPVSGAVRQSGPSWQECVDRYLQHRSVRMRKSSLEDTRSRLHVVERILEGDRATRGLSEGLAVNEVLTLEMLDYVQSRLLTGDTSRYERRSPHTVNSMLATVMAFARFCHARGWLPSVPVVEKLTTDGAMKGRPITFDEFNLMLDATPRIVGEHAAPSWQFALKVLWESGFRIGDMMDFSWNDDHHIQPVWPVGGDHFPTIIIPSSQKNGLVQEIPLLPGLSDLLADIPKSDRAGWVVNLRTVPGYVTETKLYFKPTPQDLIGFAATYSNTAIAQACGVTECAVRKWLTPLKEVSEPRRHASGESIPKDEVAAARARSRSPQVVVSHGAKRPTKEHVGRIIGLIGKEANIIVQRADAARGKRVKFASAHDLRRGCAQRLINLGVSAETLKTVMRHREFSTTESITAPFVPRKLQRENSSPNIGLTQPTMH